MESRKRNYEFFTNLLYYCMKYPTKIDYKMRRALDLLKKRKCIEYNINWDQDNKKPIILIDITQKGMKLLNTRFSSYALQKFKEIEWKMPINICDKEGVVIVVD